MSAALLLAAGLGIFRLMNRDVGEMAERLVHQLHLDPDKHAINTVLSAISNMSHAQLKAIGAGTLFYALLYLTEGVGILCGYHWAEWLIVIATGALLPLEIYELAIKIRT